MASTYCTIHPNDPHIPSEFFYGNMKVLRKRLTNDKASRQLETIFHSYVRAGILPAHSILTGDYLEHFLVQDDSHHEKPAGRFTGIIFPDRRYQYLRIDGEAVGIKKNRIETPDSIAILTDTCLFCTANAMATLENSQRVSVVAPQTRINSRIVDLNISKTLCPYEIDSILRLTSLINSLEESNNKIEKVILAMPTVEYYFYLMDAYNDGFIGTDMMLEWIQQVNRHAQKIVHAIVKRLNTPTESCQPLEYSKEYIHECIKNGKQVCFDHVMTILKDNSDIWDSVLPVTKPLDWKALNYTNYAISILMSSQCDDHESRLLIDIENPSEQRILRNASSIAKKIKSNGMNVRFCSIGIYPHEKVFFPPSGQCDGSFPRLYYMGNEQSISGVLFRHIVEANRQKMLY